MQVAESFIPYFVRVDCEAHSRHRSPEGIYLVEVPTASSLIDNACNAIQTIRDQVAFMAENLHRATVRVFTKDGYEVRVPSHMETEDFDSGFYMGRAEDFPEEITLQ